LLAICIIALKAFIFFEGFKKLIEPIKDKITKITINISIILIVY
jgi:hypothetical protein